MKIALIQQHAGKDKSANVARGLAALENAARSGAQLACFAELAFEWFYPQRPAGRGFRDLAEPLDGPTVKAFQKKSKELGIVAVFGKLAGSNARRLFLKHRRPELYGDWISK